MRVRVVEAGVVPPDEAMMPPRNLTARMLEVAHLVSEGWNNKQIADRWEITPRRVQILVTAAVVRLNLTGRDDRVTLALWYDRTQREDAA